MKITVVFGLLMISTIVKGQTEQRSNDSVTIFAPTEVGKPDGEPVSNKIGKEGGTIVSSDKKITLIVPPGALSSETLVSIQPTTNFAQESMGKAYHLQPSGIQFQQPVRLVFHYSDEEMDGQSPRAMGIASQNEKGAWINLEKVKVDTVAKTVSGDIRHFSDWALRWDVIISPIKERLKLNANTPIVVIVATKKDSYALPGDVGITQRYFGPNNIYPRTWLANDIPLGNESVGTIAESGIVSRYYAPAQIPDKNPVDIVLEIQGVTDEWGTYTLRRKCNIMIVGDRYKVKMETSIVALAGTVLGVGFFHDNGSFIVSTEEKEIKVIEIKNLNDRFTYVGNCDVEHRFKGKGAIHISGIKSIEVNRSKNPQQPFSTIDIIFVPTKAEASALKLSCPNRKGGKIKMDTGDAAAMIPSIPALPVRITFVTKEGEQIVHQLGKQGDQVFQKFTVTKVKND